MVSGIKLVWGEGTSQMVLFVSFGSTTTEKHCVRGSNGDFFVCAKALLEEEMEEQGRELCLGSSSSNILHHSHRPNQQSIEEENAEGRRRMRRKKKKIRRCTTHTHPKIPFFHPKNLFGVFLGTQRFSSFALMVVQTFRGSYLSIAPHDLLFAVTQNLWVSLLLTPDLLPAPLSPLPRHFLAVQAK